MGNKTNIWSKGKSMKDPRIKKGILAAAAARKGIPPWNKGKKGLIPWNKGLKKEKIQSGSRYIYIKKLAKNHPAADRDGYVFEHRLVMEEMLCRYLRKDEFVHHKNKIKTDNRKQNLMLVVGKVHYGECKCPNCNYKFLIR